MIKIRGKKISETDLNQILAHSEMKPTFKIFRFINAVLFHALYFLFFIPGYIVGMIIDLYNGGRLYTMYNLMFLRFECDLTSLLQDLMSIFTLLIIYYTYYILNKDPTLINIFDYADFYFQILLRIVVLGSNYAFTSD